MIAFRCKEAIATVSAFSWTVPSRPPWLLVGVFQSKLWKVELERSETQIGRGQVNIDKISGRLASLAAKIDTIQR
jgi:hypothetical protein